MKTWVWPFNWYCRIRDLEAEVRLLKSENSALESRLRAQAISQTGMTAAYIAAVSSLMETRKDWWYSGAYMRLEAERQDKAAKAEYEAFRRRLEAEQKRATDS